jgi:hypothetical protein
LKKACGIGMGRFDRNAMGIHIHQDWLAGLGRFGNYFSPHDSNVGEQSPLALRTPRGNPCPE